MPLDRHKEEKVNHGAEGREQRERDRVVAVGDHVVGSAAQIVCIGLINVLCTLVGTNS